MLVTKKCYDPQGKQHHFPITRSNHSKGFISSVSSREEATGKGNSGGKCLWNASTAAATPSSFSIFLANSIARSFTCKKISSRACLFWGIEFLVILRYAFLKLVIVVGAKVGYSSWSKGGDP